MNHADFTQNQLFGAYLWLISALVSANSCGFVLLPLPSLFYRFFFSYSSKIYVSKRKTWPVRAIYLSSHFHVDFLYFSSYSFPISLFLSTFAVQQCQLLFLSLSVYFLVSSFFLFLHHLFCPLIFWVPSFSSFCFIISSCTSSFLITCDFFPLRRFLLCTLFSHQEMMQSSVPFPPLRHWVSAVSSSSTCGATYISRNITMYSCSCE